MITEEDKTPIRIRVCKTLEGDKILKDVMQLSLSMLYSILPETIIKDVQFTGSLTAGEATVIKAGSEIICSDLDIVVSVGFPHYFVIKMKRLLPKLARYINSYLSSKGLKTHVSFSATSPLVALGLRFFKGSRIYDYEFATNISVMKREPSKVEASKSFLPTKADALQLIFTTCADRVFLDSMFESSTEKIYWLAKRYLTLLYAMLIFERKPSRSYEKRLHLALESPIITKLFSKDGLRYLKRFTEFKLMGDISQIFKALKTTNPEHLVDKLKMLLDAQIKTILLYQLNEYCKQGNTFDGLTNKASSFRNNYELLKVLKHYFDKNKKSVVNSLVYSFRFVLFSLLTKRFHLMPLAVRLFCLRHSLRVIANYLVGLLFLLHIGVVESKFHMECVLKELHLQMKDVKNIWQIANELGYS